MSFQVLSRGYLNELNEGYLTTSISNTVPQVD